VCGFCIPSLSLSPLSLQHTIDKLQIVQDLPRISGFSVEISFAMVQHTSYRNRCERVKGSAPPLCWSRVVL
jgi:hypothetical protein